MCMCVGVGPKFVYIGWWGMAYMAYHGLCAPKPAPPQPLEDLRARSHPPHPPKPPDPNVCFVSEFQKKTK